MIQTILGICLATASIWLIMRGVLMLMEAISNRRSREPDIEEVNFYRATADRVHLHDQQAKADPYSFS